MENIEAVRAYIPRGHFEAIITISSILFLNIFILNICSFLGCYEVSFTNVFRMNLFCNACTDISYHIQTHQIKVYLFIGGYLLKKMNRVIDQQIKNISPSSN